ncbi:hypothetical protein FQR65_LT03540 [Abscondita terminalis]|nr:hypothetical protein FQR65_LT03540 [Abscondita terminalis]
MMATNNIQARNFGCKSILQRTLSFNLDCVMTIFLLLSPITNVLTFPDLLHSIYARLLKMSKYHLFLLYFACVSGALTAPEEVNFTSFGIVYDLIEYHFRPQYSTLAVTGVINDVTQDLVDWTMRNYKTTPMIVAGGEEVRGVLQENVLANVVITVISEIGDFKHSLDLLTKYRFFSHQAHVFFVWTKMNQGLFMLGKVNQYIWQNNIVNFYIVYYNNRLVLVGYNPFKKKKIELLSTIESYKDMFKNKVKQLNGYKIRGGSIEDPPRAVYYQGKVRSLDVVVLESIFHRLNGSLTEIYYPSGTVKTLRNALQLSEIDFALITQFLVNYTEIVTEKKFLYTYPYVIDAVVIMVPKPKYIPAYLNIFYIFEGELWTVVVITGVVLTVLVFALDRVGVKRLRMRGGENAFFQMLRIMVNLPSAQIKRASASKKLAFSFCLVFSFFFAILFQCSLTSTLIKPKLYPKLNTLRELASSDFPICVFSNKLTMNAGNREVIEQNFVVSNKTEILKMIMKGNDTNAYMCDSLESANIFSERTRNKFRKRLFYVLDEAYMPGHRTYLFSEHSPFLHTVNNYLLMYREFGMRIYRYEGNHIKKILVPEVKELEPRKRNGPVALGVTHLQTSFFVWIFGLSVSTLVFVLEVACARLMKKKTTTKKKQRKTTL